MSAVLVLTPVVIGSWPAITAAVAAAASATGFAVRSSARTAVEQIKNESRQRVEVELADSEVLAGCVATDREIVAVKDGIELRVRRDERGRCSVCAEGYGYSESELKLLTEQFTQKLTQCFIYDKLMKELKSKAFQVVNEEVMQDQSIRIHVRRWTD